MRGEERGAREASRFGTLPMGACGAAESAQARMGRGLPESRHVLSTWLHAARIAATHRDRAWPSTFERLA